MCGSAAGSGAVGRCPRRPGPGGPAEPADARGGARPGPRGSHARRPGPRRRVITADAPSTPGPLQAHGKSLHVPPLPCARGLAPRLLMPCRGAARLRPPPGAGPRPVPEVAIGGRPEGRDRTAPGGGSHHGIDRARPGPCASSRKRTALAPARQGGPWEQAAAMGRGGGRSSGADHPKRRVRSLPAPRILERAGGPASTTRSSRSHAAPPASGQEPALAQCVSDTPATNCRDSPGSR